MFLVFSEEDVSGQELTILRRQLMIARGLAHGVQYKQMLKVSFRSIISMDPFYTILF